MSDPSNESQDPLSINTPEAIPVYSCCVLIRPSETGSGYQARVANLEDVELSASTQRDLLQKITLKIKCLLHDHQKAGTTPPWIDPPSEKREDEEERFLAIHL